MPAGNGSTASRCAWLFGHTTYDLSSTYWMHDRERALVLAGHRRALAEELDAEAEHGAAFRQIDVERGLAQRVGIDAAILLDGARQHVVHEHIGVGRGDTDMGRTDGLTRLDLVELLTDHLDHGQQARIDAIRLGSQIEIGSVSKI